MRLSEVHLIYTDILFVLFLRPWSFWPETVTEYSVGILKMDGGIQHGGFVQAGLSSAEGGGAGTTSLAGLVHGCGIGAWRQRRSRWVRIAGAGWIRCSGDDECLRFDIILILLFTCVCRRGYVGLDMAVLEASRERPLKLTSCLTSLSKLPTSLS